VRAHERDRLAEHLAHRGIGTQVYYPLPLNRQPALAARALVPSPLDATERAAAEVLALPMYPQLEDAQIDCVVEEIAAFYRDPGKRRAAH